MNQKKLDPDWKTFGPPEYMTEEEQELERCAYEDAMEHAWHAANG